MPFCADSASCPYLSHMKLFLELQLVSSVELQLELLRLDEAALKFREERRKKEERKKGGVVLRERLFFSNTQTLVL